MPPVVFCLLAAVSAASAASPSPSPSGELPRTVLERDGVEYAYPRFSKDGTSILLQSNESGRWRICTVPVSGGKPTPITPESSNCYFADWSPDNDAICFTSDDTGSEEIWVMDSDGSHRRPITANGKRNIHPYWSPDGRTILFSSTLDGGDLDIYRIAPDGTGLQPVLQGPNEETCARPSPDGKSIVLLENNDRGLDDIFLSGPGHLVPVDLTNTVTRDGWPCWTPDGSGIVYSGYEEGRFRLFLMDPRGGGRRALTSPARAFDDCRANVSPDGRFVVFNRERTSPTGKTNAILVLRLS